MKEKLLISACLMGIGCRYDGKCVKKVDVSALRERYELIPVCPEIYGGLPTPRVPSERIGEKVIMKDGRDVTENFIRGAEYTYQLSCLSGAKLALLKSRSPSCGKGEIYDGSFTGTLTERSGFTAEYLMEKGISVYTEEELERLLSE